MCQEFKKKIKHKMLVLANYRGFAVRRCVDSRGGDLGSAAQVIGTYSILNDHAVLHFPKHGIHWLNVHKKGKSIFLFVP